MFEKIRLLLKKKPQPMASLDTGNDNPLLRILTYNLLVHYKSWGGRPVKPRSKAMCSFLDDLNADVMCLQEVDQAWFMALRHLPRRYRLVEPVKTGALVHMTTLLYNKETLTLIKGGSMPYDHGYLKRNRRICYGVFKVNQTGQVITVISTHLSFVHHNQLRSLKTMSEQVAQLADFVYDLQRRYHCPVVIGGDFNCMEPSEEAIADDATVIYQLLTMHFYDVKDDFETRSRDHLFIIGGITVDEVTHLIKPDLDALSDHYPLYMDCHIDA